MQIEPYLLFQGDCAEAVSFYKRALGATVEFMQTFGESQMAGQVPPAWGEKVMHARLRFGNAVVMASDDMQSETHAKQGFSVSIGVADPAEGERIFAALADGGTVRMPMQETFWAERFGMVTDRFGVPWMVNCAKGTG